ncbi:MAG: SAM-dependent methyltransferase, partial [Bacteroidia bacterium]
LPANIEEVINQLDHYFVENEKSARHFLKKAGIKKPLQEIQLFPLNEHTEETEIISYLQLLLKGTNAGIISDAGCPAVADPGADLIRMAHENKIKVIPLVGPSSIILALMASGLNGQNFTFHGYLSRDRNQRAKELKAMEAESKRKNQTQIFIETPYRNSHIAEAVLETCEPNTLFCIAADLTLGSEFIKTATISEWKKQKPDINKRPAVFLIYKF